MHYAIPLWRKCILFDCERGGLFESHEIQKGEISQKYKDNLEKQQTFTMEINKQNFAKKQMGDYLLAPLHGGVAFLILLAGFCGLALYRKDCGRQIPFAVTGKWRREMSLFSIAVPVVLMTISGILSESFVFNNKRNCFSTDL